VLAKHATLRPMPVILHNPPGVFPPYRNYSHAAEVRGDSRLLVVSGLNGYRADGVTMPESFDDQADLIWQHLQTILGAADMELRDLISLRTYLADPAYDEPNVRMRVKYLGSHAPALTVVCCRLLDPAWKLEMEAMAAK
jgi:2-iminobutanoate/2-iminopropanoate deaminase